MARDYAKKSAKPARGFSGPLWLVGGLVLGVAVAAGLYVKTRGTAALVTLTQDMKKQGKAEAVANADKASREPTFDFYRLLPEMGVGVSEGQSEEEKTKTQVKKPAAKQNAQAPGERTYQLQVASFKTYEVADRAKAKLTLLGYDVSIKKSTHSGQTWYRVYVGPYHSLQQAKQAEKRLHHEHYQSFIVAVK